MIEPIDDATAEKIQQLPLLSSMLPYKFGGSTIDFLEITCASCSAELSPETVRGTIEAVPGGHAANLTAYGICFQCKTITPVISKFHDDGTVLVKVGKGWVKDVWSTRKRSVFADVMKYVLQRWQRVFPPVIAVLIVAGWIYENWR